jgi:hypothetical protein
MYNPVYILALVDCSSLNSPETDNIVVVPSFLLGTRIKYLRKGWKTVRKFPE